MVPGEKLLADYEAQLNTMFSTMTDSEAKQVLIFMGISASKIDKNIDANSVGTLLKKQNISAYRKGFNVWKNTP